MRIPFFSRPDWQNSDWRIREQAAFQLRDQSKLLFLAIQDVSEEVRVAASKSLRDDEHRAQLARQGFCEHARRLAIAAIQNPATLRSLLQDRALPPALRLVAGRGARLEQPAYLALTIGETDVGLRVWAATQLERSDAANPIYSFAFPTELREALVPKLTDKRLLAEIVTTDQEPTVQSLALAELTDERELATLFSKLEDPGLRRQVVDKVTTPALLEEILAEADEESLRIHLVNRLQDQALLGRIARTDRHPLVRIAAVRKLKDPAVTVAVITQDPDHRVRLAALDSVTDEASLARVARSADDEQLRWRSVERLRDPTTLAALEREAPHADVRWQVGRKLGRAPLEDFFTLTHPWTLRRIAETEPVPLLQQMAVRLVRERRFVEELATSNVAVVAEAARQVLEITGGPAGISFVPIPGMPFEFSLFVITQGQVRHLLGDDPRWNSGGDLPATGLTPEEVQKLCLLLNKMDGAVYRLPSFEEWLQATVAGDKRWFNPPPSGPIEAWTASRLHQAASAPRALGRAWPNPWGLLDAIGNVAVWVEEDPGPVSWIAHHQDRDALSRGSQPDEIKNEAFAVAAGPHWADGPLKQTRWERLVRLANLGGYGRDKVGLRLVRARRKAEVKPVEYRLVLETEPRWGLTREEVIAALARATVYTLRELERFYQVGPIVVQVSPDYEFVRKLQGVFRRCGAQASIVSKPIDLTKGAAAG